MRNICIFLVHQQNWISGCQFANFRTPLLLQIQITSVRRRIRRQKLHQFIHTYYLFRKINMSTQTFRGFQKLERHLALLCVLKTLTKKHPPNQKVKESTWKSTNETCPPEYSRPVEISASTEMSKVMISIVGGFYLLLISIAIIITKLKTIGAYTYYRFSPLPKLLYTTL